MGEDRSTLRSGNAPHAMAALRNAVLTLLRYQGWTRKSAAGRLSLLRRFCATFLEYHRRLGNLKQPYQLYAGLLLTSLSPVYTLMRGKLDRH